MTTYNVFVYGTLMKGFGNHNYYLANQENVKFLGKAKLIGYEMYHVFSFPGIVPQKGKEILGEVYKVDDHVLQQLDRLEGEGFMYKRIEDVAFLDTEKQIKVYVYVWQLSIKGCKKVDTMPWKSLINKERGE